MPCNARWSGVLHNHWQCTHLCLLTAALLCAAAQCTWCLIVGLQSGAQPQPVLQFLSTTQHIRPCNSSHPTEITFDDGGLLD